MLIICVRLLFFLCRLQGEKKPKLLGYTSLFCCFEVTVFLIVLRSC